jgi:glycosyltransferase involved in cell wall biosynthesis
MSRLLEMPAKPMRFTTTATKRVLIVARWPIGGIRTHLLYNFPALADAGYRCTIIGPDDSLDALQGGLPSPAAADFVGVPVHGAKCALWHTTRKLIQSGEYELLHSHGLTAACHGEAARFGLDIGHVATLHEPLRPERFRGLLGRFKRWTLARVLGRIDTLITVSSDARSNLLDFLPRLARRGNVLTIPNGVDTARYSGRSRDDTLRRELHLLPESRLVGYLGRFMPEKGFPLLLDALRGLAAQCGLPSYHVVAFGSGDHRRSYQSKIDAAGLTERVTLHDFVPDVAPVLRQLDLVVVPSLWEASPLVPMEALAAGVPVVGSDCPGLREVLCGTPSRTFRTGDADALRHALRGALESPWTGTAIEYADVARERFDNANSARRLVEVYEGLTVQNTRRAA